MVILSHAFLGWVKQHHFCCISVGMSWYSGCFPLKKCQKLKNGKQMKFKGFVFMESISQWLTGQWTCWLHLILATSLFSPGQSANRPSTAPPALQLMLLHHHLRNIPHLCPTTPPELPVLYFQASSPGAYHPRASCPREALDFPLF